MKVICTATSSKDFDLSDVKTVLVPNHQYDVPRIDADGTLFPAEKPPFDSWPRPAVE